MPRTDHGASIARRSAWPVSTRVPRRRAAEHDGELVAAEPRDGAAPATSTSLPRDLAQQLVAGVVAERVVDLLEAVEVDQEDGDVLAVAAAREGACPRLS